MTFLTSLEMVPLGMRVFWCCLDFLTSWCAGMSTGETHRLLSDVSGHIISSWSHVPHFPLAQANYLLQQNRVWQQQILFCSPWLIPGIIWMMESWIWNQKLYFLGKSFCWWGAIGQISEETQEWSSLVPQSVSGNQTFPRRKAGSAPHVTLEEKPSQDSEFHHSGLPLPAQFRTLAGALSCWT